jgi:hypothetical protein
MADQSPLIVPIQVEALVLNDSLRLAGGAWVRVEMQYQNLRNAGSAEPTPLNTDHNFTSAGNVGQQQNIPAAGYYDGVYLKWRLPDALTHGVQDGVTGETVYPRLPNRWLVVRTGGAGPTGWIVESDYSWPTGTQSPQTVAQVGSYYLGPPTKPGNPPATLRIGRNVPLAGGSWTEPGTSLQLTAVAPGNPGFTVYQPACNNVFSLVDTLHGQPAQSYGYLVVGWYGVPGEDALAVLLENKDFAHALAELEWELPEGTDSTATASWTLYAGCVTGVKWQESSVPEGGPPGNAVSLAVGDTSVEALTALVGQQAAAKGKTAEADLFEAFQLDMVSALDQPDGPARLTRRVHDSGFQLTDGGYRWEIVDAPGVTDPAAPDELKKEGAWLAALNSAQAQLDAARRTLASLQERLYVMWWKYLSWSWSLTPPPSSGFTQADVRNQLDPAVSGTLAYQVSQQQKTVAGLVTQYSIPTGGTPDALDAAITAYGAAQGLPSTRQLKRASLPRFALANDPVVLLSGVGSGGTTPGERGLTCRLPEQVETSLTAGGKTATPTTLGISIPLPDLSAITGAPWSTALVQSLVQEMWLMDPANAPAIAAALGVDVPAVEQAQVPPPGPPGTSPRWQQNPWHPLYLFWEAQYYPIAYGSTSSPNWTFDGTGYQWTGNGAAGTPLTLQGRILLTPAAAFNLQSRIKAYLASAPDMDPDEKAAFDALLCFVQRNDPLDPDGQTWDLLSQALDGFNDQLLQRINGATVSPGVGLAGLDPTLPALIGDAAGRAPNLGADNFQPWRSGQFYFRSLSVVDEWGQGISLVNQQSYAHVTVYKPADLTPATRVLPGTSIDFVQLQPRMLQHGRVDFQLLSATNDTQVMGLVPDVNPICGWVIPNHLDTALSAYDAAGNAMGELAVDISATDQAEVCWTPAPGSSYATLDELAKGPPHFGPFLATLAQQGTSVFNAFLAAVDETLWTTVPSGASFDTGLAVLIGRPLAMVRGSVGFGLDGPPVTDPGWAYTLKPATPAFTGYTFPVELGNVAQLEDGLIGYFTDPDQFGVFNVVRQTGAAESAYLKPIGEDGNYLMLPYDGKTVTYLSMLVDPRAGVHATTGILPAAEASLPPEYVSAALAALAVTFRVGPVLTDMQVAASSGGSPGTVTVQIPVPAQRSGTWTWVQDEGGAWKSYAVASPDQSAHLSGVSPVLRRGLMRLSLPLPG